MIVYRVAEDAKAPTAGRICILSAALLWSLSGVFVRILDMPAPAVAMYRSLSAGVFLLCVMVVRRVRPTWHPAMLVMIGAFALMNYAFIASMTETTAANAIFLQYTAPLWMTVGSVCLLGESSDRRQWIVLLGSLVGVGVIVAGNVGGGGSHARGIGLGLISGFLYATVAVSLRYLRRHDSLWLTTANHFSAGMILLILNLGMVWGGTSPTERIGFPQDSARGATLIAFGIVQMAIPYLLFGIGLRRVTPQEAGLLTLIEPVLNPIWTFLAIGETPSLATVLGGGILMSMLLFRYVPAAAR